ncbi:MAG: hypothetical protein BA863_00995 [Desulfovibrio sp. S3730MH75]|nr:MAG: hypothetical protein BA863_00995 [Desulfovibrio sp. S3730MH75]
MNVVIASKPLKSLEEIKEYFGVGAERVKVWQESGAPVIVLKNSKGEIQSYKSEYNRLFDWVEKFYREKPL